MIITADGIRLASASDSEEILKIYSPYITESAVSFETEVPSIKEFGERIAGICVKYPYLVYLSDNRIVAYTYASRYRERAAYCYDVELSIYSLPEFHSKGIAQRLYSCLFAILRELGYYNAYAGYTVPNEKSMRFHQKLGFTSVGVYHNVGYKFGSWYDVEWLEKAILPLSQNPQPVKLISDLQEDVINAILRDK